MCDKVCPRRPKGMPEGVWFSMRILHDWASRPWLEVSKYYTDCGEFSRLVCWVLHKQHLTRRTCEKCMTITVYPYLDY